MKRTTARLTIGLAAAAIVALPASGFAQDPPAQPPTSQQQPPPSAPAQAPQQSASEDAARAHLTAARNTLSQLTQLPAATQLQGETRAQVAQLINNFNELITTPADWKASYAKVEGNLNALLGAGAEEPARPAGTPGAVGTSGTKPSLDPAIRAKLMEMRTQLDQFEKAAGAPSAEPAAPPAAATATAPAATPPAATPPAATPPTAAPSSTTTTTTTTSRTTTPTPPAPADPPAEPPSTEPVTISPQEMIQHIEAIEVILSAHAAAQNAAQSAAGGAVTTSPTPSGSTRTTVTSGDVRLTPEQLTQVKAHLAEMRRLLQKK
jgi:hypothetical protein